LTGSHRLEALKFLDDEGFDLDSMECAEDVTDIIEEAMSRFEEENGYLPDIQFDNIGWLLEGSWVEQYKGEIAEW